MAKKKEKEAIQPAAEVQAEAAQESIAEKEETHQGDKIFLAKMNFMAGKGNNFSKGDKVLNPHPDWIKDGLVAEA